MVDLRSSAVDKAKFETVRDRLRHPEQSADPEKVRLLGEVILSLDKLKGDRMDLSTVEQAVSIFRSLDETLSTIANSGHVGKDDSLQIVLSRVAVMLLHYVRHACVSSYEQERRSAKQLVPYKLQKKLLETAAIFARVIAAPKHRDLSSLLFNFTLEFLDVFGIFPPQMETGCWQDYLTVFIPMVAETCVEQRPDGQPGDIPIISPLLMKVLQNYHELHPEGNDEKEYEIIQLVSMLIKIPNVRLYSHLLELIAYGDLKTKRFAFKLLQTNYPAGEFIGKGWDWASPYSEFLLYALMALFQENDRAIIEYSLKLLNHTKGDRPHPPKEILGMLLAGVISLLDPDFTRAPRISSANNPTMIKSSYSGGERSNSLFARRKKGSDSSFFLEPSASVINIKAITEFQVVFQAHFFPWLTGVRTEFPDLFCEVLSPHPPDFALMAWSLGNLHPEKGEFQIISSFERFGALMANDKVGDSFHVLMPRWLDYLAALFGVTGGLEAKVDELSQDHLIRKASVILRSIFTCEFTTSEKDGFWHFIKKRFQEGPAGAADAINWLKVLTQAEILIPPSVVYDLSKENKHSNASELNMKLLEVLWLQVTEGIDIPLTITNLFEILLTVNMQADQDRSGSMASANILKYTIALSLFSIGCPLKHIQSYGFLKFEIPPEVDPLDVPDSPDSAEPPREVELHPESTPFIQILLYYLNNSDLIIREDVVKCFHLLILFTDTGVKNRDDFAVSIQPYIMQSLWEMLSPKYSSFVETTIELLLELIAEDYHYFHLVVDKEFSNPKWNDRYFALENLYSFFSKLELKFLNRFRTGDFTMSDRGSSIVASRRNSSNKDTGSIHSERSGSNTSSYANSFGSTAAELRNTEESPIRHLCPVFLFFFKALSDPESLVRAKAQTLLQSLNPGQLESVVLCFEEWLSSSSCTLIEKVSVCKQLLRINATFPTLLVLRWTKIIEIFRETVPLLQTTESDSSSLMSKKKKGKKYSSKLQTEMNSFGTEEEAHFKSALITISLQMLGNGVSIRHSQLMSLKFIFAGILGFLDPKKEEIGEEVKVEFRRLKLVKGDKSQRLMLNSFTNALLKVLDADSFLILERSSPLPEIESEIELKPPTRQNEYAKEFVKFVVMMFDNDFNLPELEPLELASWLKLLIVVLFKHDLNEERKAHEESIKSIISHVLDLLNHPIGEENQQLVVSACAAVLKSNPVLALGLMPKIFPSLGVLVTDLKIQRKNATCFKVCSFFAEVLERFHTVPGFFLQIFKSVEPRNPSQQTLNTATLGKRREKDRKKEETILERYDLILILKTVFSPAASVSTEFSNLQQHSDWPIKDILISTREFLADPLGQQITAPHFTTCMSNLARYIDEVFPRNLEEKDGILSAASELLKFLKKFTDKAKLQGWSFSSFFEVLNLLQLRNRKQSNHISSHLKDLLRDALINTEVSLEALVGLHFGFIPPGSSESLVRNYLIDIMTEFFGSSNRPSVVYFETLIQYIKFLALTFFDPPGMSPLPNTEVSLVVKKIFHDNPPKKQGASLHSEKFSALFIPGLDFLKQYHSSYRKMSPQLIFQMGRWTSFLLVGLWAQSNDRVDLFSMVFAKSGMKTPRCLSWLLYGIVVLESASGITDILAVMFANTTAIAEAIHSCFQLDKLKMECPIRGLFILRSWTFIVQTMLAAGNSVSIIDKEYPLNLELKVWSVVWPTIKWYMTSDYIAKKLEADGIELFRKEFIETILFMLHCGSGVFSLYSADLACFLTSLPTESKEKENALFQLRHPFEIISLDTQRKILDDQMKTAVEFTLKPS